MTASVPVEAIAALVRVVPDFPKPGILFRDLSPLLADGQAFQAAVAAMADLAGPHDLIAGVEARGFLFSAALAQASGRGLLLVRKPGKLPMATIAHDYQLEYGKDRLEIHADAVRPGARVLLVDDVLATGGTAAAAVALLRKAGAEVAEALFLMELATLPGRARLASLGVHPRALLSF